MKKIPIKDATEAQLRAFGESHLGMQFDANEKKASVLSKVQAAWTKDDIEIADDQPPKKAAAGSAPQRPETQDGEPVLTCRTKKNETEPLVRVLINRTDGAGGADDVPLGCNGEIMMVPRGKMCDIPKRYFESLKNSVEFIYDPTEDGKGLNPIPRQVPKFPYQVYQPRA